MSESSNFVLQSVILFKKRNSYNALVGKRGKQTKHWVIYIAWLVGVIYCMEFCSRFHPRILTKWDQHWLLFLFICFPTVHQSFIHLHSVLDLLGGLTLPFPLVPPNPQVNIDPHWFSKKKSKIHCWPPLVVPQIDCCLHSTVLRFVMEPEGVKVILYLELNGILLEFVPSLCFRVLIRPLD